MFPGGRPPVSETPAPEAIVLVRDPAHGKAWAALARRADEARSPHLGLAFWSRAVSLDGGDASSRSRLGLDLLSIGAAPAACRQLRRTLALAPDLIEAANNIGTAALECGDGALAERWFRRATRLVPSWPVPHANLGNALEARGGGAEAAASYARALALAPVMAEVWSNHGLHDLAMLDHRTAFAKLRRALTISPNAVLHGNLRFALGYDIEANNESLFAESRRLTSFVPRQPARSLRNDRNPDRPLRVGYLSGDFRSHPVAWNVFGLLANHDPSAVQTISYAAVTQPDDVTDTLRSVSHEWRWVGGLDDAALARLIESDRIDILVILAGMTASNRLSVARHRPAPIQISFHDLMTSGLPEVDYWLTDERFHPRDTTERFTETLIRLPCFYLHNPPSPSPSVSTDVRSGPVVFGSSSNPPKLNDAVIELWARILRDVPDSRLRLGYFKRYASAPLRDEIGGRFERRGVDRRRLDFVVGSSDRREQLEALNSVDIALDPFPFNGSTATFEALWMGIPVVSLAGDRFLSRVGAGLLPHVGLGDLVAPDGDAYVERAAGLARNASRRADLKRTLRDRLLSSPLCDAPGYARSVEAAYRRAWRHWCRTGARLGQAEVD